MPEIPLRSLVERAIEAAFAAGREIMSIYGEAFHVAHKADTSPLTEADKRAHEVISRILSDTRLPILSEEGSHTDPSERQAWEQYWLVDPLDGTKEFVKRNGEFTVNIALMQRDALPLGSEGAATPMAGVLYVPVKDLLYFSWKGGGSYRQEHAATFQGIGTYDRASMSAKLPMVEDHGQAFTIVASRSHKSPETEAFIQRMQEEHEQVELTTIGSALKICLVAEGSADVYPRYAPTMEWDTAAGHAICLEAGKQITDITTDAPMRYNKTDLVNNWFIVQ
ncbi:MAG: 3'(2'),5'-bisphosphate nucleotidase CysQ [Bacteroidota bacterium]|nr:3'(2'),5'-bisphosphate nucleotidase CysQ [Bacteroidota bacterium]